MKLASVGGILQVISRACEFYCARARLALLSLHKWILYCLRSVAAHLCSLYAHQHCNQNRKFLWMVLYRVVSATLAAPVIISETTIFNAVLSGEGYTIRELTMLFEVFQAIRTLNDLWSSNKNLFYRSLRCKIRYEVWYLFTSFTHIKCIPSVTPPPPGISFSTSVTLRTRSVYLHRFY